MKKLTPAILMTLAALVGVLCIGFVGALYWINSAHFRSWLQSRIDQTIPGAITIRRHQVSLLTPRLSLEGVVLLDPRGVALAGIERCLAEMDWTALVRGELRLTRILIEKPWADLTVDTDTGLNLTAALTASTSAAASGVPEGDRSGRAVPLVVESMRLTDGRIAFTPADPATRIDADGITVVADAHLATRSVNLDLSVARLHVRTPTFQPEAARIALKARLEGSRLTVDTMDVVSDGNRLHLAGFLENLDAAPRIDAALTIDGSLAALMSSVQPADGYGGAITADLKLQGLLSDPQASLQLTLDKGRIAGQPIDRADGRITLRDGRLAVDSLAVQLADGAVNLKGALDLRAAFPAGIFHPPTDINALSYTADVEATIPDLTPWTRRATDLGGGMAGRLSLNGQGVFLDRMTAELTVDGSARQLIAEGMAQPMDASWKMAARMQNGRLSIDRLQTLTDGSELEGSGWLDWPDRTVDMRLALHADDLSRPLAVLGRPFATGSGRATVTARGTIRRPEFAATLAASDLAVQGVSLGRLAIEAEADPNGRLHLTTLSLDNRGSRIRGKGRARLLPDARGTASIVVDDLDLTLDNVTTADFLPTPPIQGTFDGRLDAQGPLASLTAELTLTGSGIGAVGMTIGAIDARCRWAGGTLNVERLRIDNQGSVLTVDGQLGLTSPGSLDLLKDPTFSLNVASDRLDPAAFVDDVSGRFRLDADLNGSLQDPRGRIILDGRQIRAAGQPLRSLSLNAHLDARRLWLDRCRAVIAADETVDGSGWIGLDGSMDLQLTSTGIAVANIHRLQALFPGSGMLRVDVKATGTVSDPDVDGRATLADIRINDETIEDFNLAFRLHDETVRAKGNLNFALDATCNLRTGDVEGHLVFDRTDTAAYFKAAGQPDLGGSLTGRVDVSGNIRQPADLSAEIDLSHLDLLYQRRSLIRSERIVARLANRTVIIPGIDLALLSSGHLTLSGEARIGGPVNLAVDGRLPLEAAQPFSDELATASGSLKVAGTVTGDTANPQMDARIDLDKIGMALPGLTQRLRDLNGRIYLTGDRIRMDGVKGYLDTGSIQIDGTVTHERFAPQRLDLTVAARSLPLEIPDTLEVMLNGDLTITGKDRVAAATGTLVLLEGLYYRDVNFNLLQLTSTVVNRQRAVEPPAAPLSIPWFDTVNLDIKVGHRQPFSVDNNLARLEISPDLKIGGTLAVPILSGRALVIEGDIIFQKKTFVVQKGVIDFINPYRTEAAIDIQSTADIRTWQINLAIEGTPDNLRITLTSVPSETESDILSLILFGRTAQELSAGEGGGGRTTSQIVAEMIADTMGADIKKTTGLDILEVEATDSDDEADVGGVKVTVGKRLSERMTVKYAVETKDGETVQTAITEYKLLENILMSGFQDSQGVYGSELTFRIEFR